MGKQALTRRAFLGVSASATALMVTGCPMNNQGQGVVVYRRSGRGRRVSNAAKKHNANRLYKNLLAATLDTPHPGDNSKVVKITINRATYDRLFAGGRTVADLRHDL
jgi:hypothetical protein